MNSFHTLYIHMTGIFEKQTFSTTGILNFVCVQSSVYNAQENEAQTREERLHEVIYSNSTTLLRLAPHNALSIPLVYSSLFALVCLFVNPRPCRGQRVIVVVRLKFMSILAYLDATARRLQHG